MSVSKDFRGAHGGQEKSYTLNRIISPMEQETLGYILLQGKRTRHGANHPGPSSLYKMLQSTHRGLVYQWSQWSLAEGPLCRLCALKGLNTAHVQLYSD